MNTIHEFFAIGASLPTMTDWIQTICIVCYTLITLVGTVYIVRTFQAQARTNEEQKAINKQQIELNLLALEKHRRSIRPIFVIRRSGATWLTITVENAPAFNVKFVPRIEFGDYLDNLELQFEQFFEKRDSLTFELPSRDIDENGSHVLDILFEDEDGRKYKQFLWCDDNDTIHFPKLQTIS